jgi:hypothetical protein
VTSKSKSNATITKLGIPKSNGIDTSQMKGIIVGLDIVDPFDQFEITTST